jgi:hypothetical protein
LTICHILRAKQTAIGDSAAAERLLSVLKTYRISSAVANENQDMTRVIFTVKAIFQLGDD